MLSVLGDRQPPYFLTIHQSYSVSMGQGGALRHVGHSEGGGISTTGVFHPYDEVIGSSGALHQRENVSSLYLVTFSLQQLHIFIQKLGCRRERGG